MRVYGDVCGRCERKSQAREHELSHRTSQGITSLVTSESLCTMAPRCASTSLCLCSGTCGRLRRHVRYSTTSTKRACAPSKYCPHPSQCRRLHPKSRPRPLGTPLKRSFRSSCLPLKSHRVCTTVTGPPRLSTSSPRQGRQAFSRTTTLSGRVYVTAGRQPYS